LKKMRIIDKLFDQVETAETVIRTREKKNKLTFLKREKAYHGNYQHYCKSVMLRILLLPAAMIMHIALLLRHLMFDWGLIKSKAFDLPVICVGNLSMGGTGKTPQVEYLVRLLQKNYRLATLSRGYLRKTKGFLLARAGHTYRDIGDEPCQYLSKFPEIYVAVDEKRKNGIEQLLKLSPAPEVILLDDAFQHRYVRPGLNILLTDYHNLYPNDFLFPAGKLRDIEAAARRAEVIVVTKTPKIFSPFTRRRLKEILRPRKNQELFFSYLSYGTLKPVVDNPKRYFPKTITTILMFCGIANPYPFEEYLRDKCTDLIVHDFPDHHDFSEKDINEIVKQFNDILGKNKILVTTEKDAMRLIDSPYFSKLETLPLFYVSVEAKFHDEHGRSFDEYILEYVKKNTGNSRIHP